MKNDLRILQTALRTDLGAFLEKAVGTILPGTTYLPNWHVDAIVHQLNRVTAGEWRRLLVNQPPRSLKSIAVSVAYVAWLLGRNPAMRIIVVSYSREFAAELHRQFRLVVASDWYKKIFPATLWARETEFDFITRQGGGRFATSIGGTITGRGADLIVIDDPLNASEAQSEPARNRVIDFFGASLVSRLNDKGSGAIIVVMQRLHADDLAGHLLRQGGWYHLNLPAIAFEDEDIPLDGGRTYHRRIGDPLHADRESLATLARVKAEIGSLMFSAQYQQAPVPLEGNLIKREWLQFYERIPTKTYGMLVVQSWDIATMTGVRNDFSVCTTWLVGKDNVHLLSIWRGRLAYPDLRHKVIDLACQAKADTIIIEEAGPGLSLLQDFAGSLPVGMTRPIGKKPEGSKADRMAAQSARFESRFVYLPKENPSLADYINELLAFPNDRHDDQVDSTSQFLGWWWDWRGRTHGHVGPVLMDRPDVDRWAYR